MLPETLQSFGLNNKEISVYLATLELGKAKVSQISHKSKVERTHCYSILGKLESLGFVKELASDTRKMFVAEPPENMVKFQKQRLDKVQEVMPELKSIYNLAPKKPKIRFYEGRDGLITIFEEVINTLDKGDTYYHCGPDFEKLVEVIGQKTVSRLIRKRVNKGIFSKVITNKTPFTHKLYQERKSGNRDHRYLEKKEIPARIHIFGPKVALVSLDERMGVIIEDQAIADLMRMFFSTMWASLPKLK